MADGRADTVSRVEPTTTTPQAAPAKAPAKAVDNADQAALAEQQREFTVGGDGPAANLPPPPSVAIALGRLDAAVAGVRRTERPSPFGVSQFPPLPQPSSRKAKP